MSFFSFQITSKVERFSKFRWVHLKNHIITHQTTSRFTFKKILLNKKSIFLVKKYEIQVTISDYAHSFFNQIRYTGICKYLHMYSVKNISVSSRTDFELVENFHYVLEQNWITFGSKMHREKLSPRYPVHYTTH